MRRCSSSPNTAEASARKVSHTLGAGWKKAGQDVFFGARDASAADSDVRAVSMHDALAAGDVVVNGITGAAALDAITALDTSALADKTLLDAANTVTATGDLVHPIRAWPSVCSRHCPACTW